MKPLIDPEEEVVLAFAIVRKSDWDKAQYPPGSIALAWEVGEFRKFSDQQFCKGWGAMISTSLARAAKKFLPEEMGKIIRLT